MIDRETAICQCKAGESAHQPEQRLLLPPSGIPPTSQSSTSRPATSVPFAVRGCTTCWREVQVAVSVSTLMQPDEDRGSLSPSAHHQAEPAQDLPVSCCAGWQSHAARQFMGTMDITYIDGA